MTNNLEKYCACTLGSSLGNMFCHSAAPSHPPHTTHPTPDFCDVCGVFQF